MSLVERAQARALATHLRLFCPLCGALQPVRRYNGKFILACGHERNAALAPPPAKEALCGG